MPRSLEVEMVAPPARLLVTKTGGVVTLMATATLLVPRLPFKNLDVEVPPALEQPDQASAHDVADARC